MPKKPTKSAPVKKQSTHKPKDADHFLNHYPDEPKSDADLRKVQNGLQDLLLAGAQNPGSTYTSQNVSQTQNIFTNLRWYFISNMYQPLSEAYCELGLVQTVVNVPVDDGLRGGVDIQTKQLSPDQISALQDVMDREDDVPKVGQGLKWTRLYGGGAVLILTDQDWTTPLDVNALTNNRLEFRAIDMWELYFDTQNTTGGGYDNSLQDERVEYYSYYGKKVHKSRVLKMVGIAAPSFLRPKLRGWGFSVVEAMVRSINQYLEGTNLIYELIGESKIDVYGIKNLTSTLMGAGEAATAAVARRIQIANQYKDYQHAIVMDGEDTYAQKQLTFSGLAEVMNQVRMQIASDLRMPITKIFGISAAGFNSGEDDIEVYNSMIESTIRSIAKKDILKVVELRCQQLFGMIPTDLSISFQPLRVLSGEQEQKVKTEKFNRLLAAMQAGALSLEEFRMACNKDDLLEIQLNNDNLMEGSDEVGNVPGEQGEEEASEEAPGE